MASAKLAVDMFVAHRVLEERAYRAAVAAGAANITSAQARLLARVGPTGTRLIDLAAEARVTKQTAGHLVDQLEAGGYVRRVQDPDDGRARLVQLTAKSQRLVPVANAEIERTLQEWATRLGERRLRQLEDSLAALREIIDPEP